MIFMDLSTTVLSSGSFPSIPISKYISYLENGSETAD